MADKNRIFVDTNIWLYAFMDGKSEKVIKSRQILSKGTVILSSQVLNEISINLIKKARYTEENLQILIVNISNHFKVVPVNSDTILQASFIREKMDIDYWDSLIISSALINDCKVLYSDILPHNITVEGKLKIINPFV